MVGSGAMMTGSGATMAASRWDGEAWARAWAGRWGREVGGHGAALDGVLGRAGARVRGGVVSRYVRFLVLVSALASDARSLNPGHEVRFSLLLPLPLSSHRSRTRSYQRTHTQAGHQALSESKAVNTALGVLAHTFVLTPYHAWRVTHAMHHVRPFSSLCALSLVRLASPRCPSPLFASPYPPSATLLRPPPLLPSLLRVP